VLTSDGTSRSAAIRRAVLESTVRSLDAVHLAMALHIRDQLTAFVAYDSRLADAARAAGLPVAAPAG
jgi:uncharacterized protein